MKCNHCNWDTTYPRKCLKCNMPLCHCCGEGHWQGCLLEHTISLEEQNSYHGILTKPQDREIKFARQFKSIIDMHRCISSKGQLENESREYYSNENLNYTEETEKVRNRARILHSSTENKEYLVYNKYCTAIYKEEGLIVTIPESNNDIDDTFYNRLIGDIQEIRRNHVEV